MQWRNQRWIIMVTPLLMSCIDWHRRMECRNKLKRVVVRLHVTIPGVHGKHSPRV